MSRTQNDSQLPCVLEHRVHPTPSIPVIFHLDHHHCVVYGVPKNVSNSPAVVAVEAIVAERPLHQNEARHMREVNDR